MPAYEQTVVEVAPQTAQYPTFYERNRESLAEVFGVLGKPLDALDNLEDTVLVTQEWTGGDHTRPNYEIDLTEEESKKLRGLYGALGLLDERQLPPGHYEQIILLGAKQVGNNRRLDMIGRMLTSGQVTTDRMVWFGGERHKEPDEADMTARNFAELGQRSGTDVWTGRILKQPERVRWETDLIRLAGAAQLGPLALKQLHLRVLDAAAEPKKFVRIPDADPISHYELEWNGTPVTLLHSQAVNRPNGEARHTSESCADDWLEIVPPAQGARVGFVTGNPHIERATRSVHAKLHKAGRDDVNFIGSGSAANPYQKHQIFLGEIARNLYEDLMARES